MNDSVFCPKCKTGTIRKLNRDESMCDKCGKIYGASAQAPPPKNAGHAPRPGGNRYVG
jgi:ribosomal protein L37AE/L43A